MYIFKPSNWTSIENIVFSASHTHSCPEVSHTEIPAVAEFLAIYKEGLLTAAQDALADRKPATMERASAETKGANFVRRYILEDGTPAGDNYGHFDKSPIKCHESEADRQMQFVKFVREGKKDIVMVNFQTHPDVVGNETLTADWPGLTRTVFEAATMGKARCIVLNGTQGDVNHVNVMPRPGFSTQQLMEAMEQVYAETMDPAKVGMDYQDMSFQENKVRNSTGLATIFAMSSVFAFLILVALYEKWTLPLAIFLTVPIAVLGAFVGLWMTGLDLNMYAQIGLVMLVGLAAKNAILIVEFAVLQMERGQILIDAAVTAARMRLRPILMTSFAFILGCVPLVTAAGSGALARNSIGIVVVVGMSIATALGVFFIPCSFVFIMKLFRSKVEKAHHGADPDEEFAYAKLAEDEN